MHAVIADLTHLACVGDHGTLQTEYRTLSAQRLSERPVLRREFHRTFMKDLK
jgi:hypothetical protein